jgi:drug/metabolite transporter (DMT)-like permease
MLKLLPILFYVATTAAGLIILKLSTANGLPISYIDGKFAFNFNWLAFLGIFFYGVSFLSYFYLISKFDLGYIIPLTTALVYTVIFFASFIIFKESFTMVKILAIVLILTGLALLNINK